MKKPGNKLKKIVELDRKISNTRTLSATERSVLESSQRFEATYYSNKLEGNKLSKDDARKAVLSVES